MVWLLQRSAEKNYEHDDQRPLFIIGSPKQMGQGLDTGDHPRGDENINSSHGK